MDKVRSAGKRAFSVLLDDGDYDEVVRIARTKRSNIAQVCREFIVAGVDRERRLQEAEAVA